MEGRVEVGEVQRSWDGYWSTLLDLEVQVGHPNENIIQGVAGSGQWEGSGNADTLVYLNSRWLFASGDRTASVDLPLREHEPQAELKGAPSESQ